MPITRSKKTTDKLARLRAVLLPQHRTLHDFASQQGTTYVRLWNAVRGQSQSDAAKALVAKVDAFLAKHEPAQSSAA